MNFIWLYHNHLAHKSARWRFTYISYIFILYFDEVYFFLILMESHHLSVLPQATSLERI